MMHVNNLMIGDPVLYNDTICRVYSLSNALPLQSEKFNNQPVIMLDHGGLIDALEEEVFGLPIDFAVTQFGWQETKSSGYFCYKFYDELNSIILYKTPHHEWSVQWCDPAGTKLGVCDLVYVHELIHILKLLNANETIESIYKKI